jgi:hypothetical protein
MNETLLDIVENLEQAEAPVQARTETQTSASREAGTDSGSAEPGGDAEPQLLPGVRVVCIAGRGAFDEVCTTIAVQLLARRGIPTSSAQYAQFRKGSVESGMIEGAPIICIVTLDASEAPPYLRNLVRRIRERAPAAVLIVGIGSGQTERDSDTNPLNGTANVNGYAELVEQCLHAATNAAPSPPRLAEKSG